MFGISPDGEKESHTHYVEKLKEDLRRAYQLASSKKQEGI